MTQVSALRTALLGWAPDGWRELPWRRTRDPWAVLVSELMLQQTQVVRVVPLWQSFMDRWPTPYRCAEDPVADVVRAWAGLGYNRRALHLHRCAIEVVERHGGRLPADLDALLALPGIGPYTARAVLAFAFDADVGVVDTNTARVAARAVAGRRLAPAEAQAAVDRLVPPGRGWEWNQAMLDLGAQVCTARRPRCHDCPLAPECTWLRTGGDDPALRSAGVTRRQSTFRGSDREGRGRLVDALRAGPVAVDDLARVCGWPEDPVRSARIAAAVVREGFAFDSGGALELSAGR
ncbi:MAG: A/G-specific adenine glycosylase [Acidimicrobiales bacterium]